MESEDLFNLPPGFRFHPNDEELIVHYLLNKVNQRSVPTSVIRETELYKVDPWDLPRKAAFGTDGEWYFFSPRDRKYPNGSRPRRSAGSGFWKATGKDKPIFASSGSRKIGVKKPLAFFSGSPTKSVKTNWIMSEYRLLESSSRSSKLKGSMRLDDWVLCRVRQKGNMAKNKPEVEEKPKNNHIPTTAMAQELPSSYLATKAHMDLLSDRWFKDFQKMALILAGQEVPPMIETGSPKLLQSTKTNSNTGIVYENDENIPFMFNDGFKHKDIYTGNVLTSEELFGVLDPNHLDVVMKLFKDGSFNQA